MLTCGLDIETTGLRNGDHKIIEIYLGLWDGESLVDEYLQRIDPQRQIGAEAQRIHGISSSDLIGMPTFKIVANDIVTFMARADVYAGHNIQEFDLPFITDELTAVGLALPERPIIDSFLQGNWATPDGKKPNLGELCFATGVEYDTKAAHSAKYDVTVNMAAINNAIRWGFIQLPEPLKTAA